MVHSDFKATTPAMLYGEGDRLAILRQILQAMEVKSIPTIHLAGTNGKGSTATMISLLLGIHFDRIGLFTSPHFYTERESIQVDGQMISEIDFQEAYHYLEGVISQLGYQIDREVSQFELTFLMAMYYFAKKDCQFLVLECGLGGSLDATNAIASSDYAVFTKIGLDHMGILGNTLEVIASTKAGIMRPAKRMVMADHQRPVVVDCLKKIAQDQAVTVIEASQTQRQAEDHTTHAFIMPSGREWRLQLQFQAPYQWENLTTALTLFDDLVTQKALSVTEDQIQEALEGFSIWGRMEQVQEQPAIYLDAAHNPDAMEVFIQSLRAIQAQRQAQKVAIVCGFLKDKDVANMVDQLSEVEADFYLTEVEHPDRYLPLHELEELFKAKDIAYQAFQRPIEALEDAVNSHDLIFVVGSFYLLQPIRKEWLARAR